MTVEVKIGVQHAPRELTVDTDSTSDEVHTAVERALQQDHGIFSLSDTKGRTVVVPADKLAYVYFTAEGTRKVGFDPATP